MSGRQSGGRAVLVTGGSGGIGRAIAQAFAAAGDRVAVHYSSRPDAAESVANSLEGDGHTTVGCDLADGDAVRTMVDVVHARLGAVDVLVNNAGVYQPHPIESTTYEEWQAAWRATIDVNLLGTANVTWCVATQMPRGGRIVNVSSRGAFRGEPQQPAYGASKAGMIALAQSLARSLGPRGISVTSVAPGFVETDMTAAALEGDQRARRIAESPLGRIASPADVAAAVFFLASPEAEMVSGSVVDLNGASHLRM